MTSKHWTIKRGHRVYGGFVVKRDKGGILTGSYPVIKNPALRFLYPLAILRAMRECKKLARRYS